MSRLPTTPDTQSALTQLESALAEKKLSPTAADNIRAWLTEPRYAQYAPQVAEHIAAGKWQTLDDVFWTVIPFGTGGRRGRMYPIGTNAINDRTMGESAQGLADYVKEHSAGGELSCAVAYDTRHRSREFAELCAEVMAAAGFKVYFLDGFRSTPELSFAVRHFGCACGTMISASHNPPSDNAIKAYWSTGGQLLPPHDRGVIDRVMSVETIDRVPFAEAREAGKVVYCQSEVDPAYQAAVLTQDVPGPREVKILYSPMHGVGASSVCPILEAAGFKDVEVFGPHAEPDGDFPNVPGHVSNPENPATFDSMIEYAESKGFDLILSTDPDADRLGAAAPATKDGPWVVLNGNQLGAILADYVLDARRQSGTLTADHYIITTLVTTQMIRRVADYYGVRTYGDLRVGFKWIAGVIDDAGPDKFIYGTEESHGFMCGAYNRDKDGAVAALMLAGLAARSKAEGRTVIEKLDSLYWQFGFHAEKTISKMMPGAQGLADMKRLMERLRSTPPRSFGGLAVRGVRDYLQQRTQLADGSEKPLEGPRGDLVIFDLEAEGNYVAIRPSGTEPKVKFYMFTFEPPEQIADLDETKVRHAEQIEAYERDVTALIESV